MSSNTAATIKFLCSYGGKIIPRPSDGRLRYVGGHTRILSVDRLVSHSELILKLGELCGYSVTLRCQLPQEDLDVLVSIKSDEDLANLIEEYHQASMMNGKDLKIRAILSPPKSLKQISTPSPVSSSSSSVDLSPTKSAELDHLSSSAHRCVSSPNSSARPILVPKPSARYLTGRSGHAATYGVAWHHRCQLQTSFRPCNLLVSHSKYQQ